MSFRLPNQLQPQLNPACLRGCGTNHTRLRYWRSACVEDRIVRIVQKVRGGKIWVIQDVEELRPKLDIEGFRDSRNVSVLEDGEVYSCEARPVDAVAACVANKIRTSTQDDRTPGIALARVRRLKAKGLALRSDIRSRLRESEAFCVEVFNAALNRVATLNEVCKVHGKVPVKARAQGITASSDCRCKWRTSGRGDDGAKLPTSGQI